MSHDCAFSLSHAHRPRPRYLSLNPGRHSSLLTVLLQADRPPPKPVNHDSAELSQLEHSQQQPERLAPALPRSGARHAEVASLKVSKAWPPHTEPRGNPRPARCRGDYVREGRPPAAFDRRRRQFVGELIVTVERHVPRPGETHRIDRRGGQRPVLRGALSLQSRPGGRGYTLGCRFSLLLDREAAS